MPNGNVPSPLTFTSRNPAALAGFKSKSRVDHRAIPLSPIGFQSRNTELLAQNAKLQSELERHRAKAHDLRSILCSMDIAALCVGADLKLRLFSAAAGHMLGLGPENVDSTLSLYGPFCLNGTLISQIRAVLGSGSGSAEEQVVAMPCGQQFLCRFLPVYTAEAGRPTVNCVVITFDKAPPASGELPKADLKGHCRHANSGRDDHGLGSGLTTRQSQVLHLVLAGHPSKNIAADLGISRRTVDNHRAAIMARTGATSLPALARLAIGADVGGDCKAVLSRSTFE